MRKKRPSARKIAKRPTGSAEPDLRSILVAWSQHVERDFQKKPERYCELGQRAAELGHAPLAYEILRHGLMAYPQHQRLLYLTALASVKTGSYAAATDYLHKLVPRLKGRSDLYIEARSLEGRIAKDNWARLPSGREKSDAGNAAVAAYESVYAASHSYFPGINAATMNVLLGRLPRGRELAREVHGLCLRKLRGGRSSDHWLFATLGEASLLMDERQDALRWYRRAAAAAKKRVGDIATMRRQLRLLESVLSVGAELYGALAVPKVAVFTGHMLDRSGRSNPRFPSDLEAAVGASIRAQLKDGAIGIGYCSAACGADILFIEQMRKRGAEVHITLPFNRDDFVATSVAFAGTSWVRRFERALSSATSVTYAVQERYLGDDTLFEYTASLTQGAALLRAQQLETEALMLSVVDEDEAEQPGGTLSALAAWRKHHLPLRLIDLSELRADHMGHSVGIPSAKNLPATSPHLPAPASRRKIKTMLFADMVGFSKLQEEDTPAFLVHFLGEIARVIRASDVEPDFLNTWGDGLFLVFESASNAAEFALQLRDAVRDTPWHKHGLPADTNIRIGMHSGPVFPAVDPIIQKNNFFGSHVNRAARIEPVTAPGAVYISEQTAALLTASRSTQFACDFLGSVPLAKHFGDSVLYRLRRTHELE